MNASESLTTQDSPVTATPAPTEAAAGTQRRPDVQPVLEQLFALYPHLFGEHFLPLKLGIFQELLAGHPEHFEKESLKAALALHTRSTPYLKCVAAGLQRHDLQGQAHEAVAPEHVYFAIVELHRRRQARTPQDLSGKLKSQLLAAFEASGLSRQDYLSLVQTRHGQPSDLLEQALEEHAEKLAKQEALRRAFESSAKSVDEFAAMYGLDPRAVHAMLGSRLAHHVGHDKLD